MGSAYEDLTERRVLLLNEIEDMTAILERDGYMQVGSTGQPTAHPLIAARHQAFSQLRMVESQLRRQTEEEEQALRTTPVHLRGRP